MELADEHGAWPKGQVRWPGGNLWLAASFPAEFDQQAHDMPKQPTPRSIFAQPGFWISLVAVLALEFGWWAGVAEIVRGSIMWGDMADDKSKNDKRDRSRVAAGEAYEVEYLAKKTGISAGAVRQLIKTHGNNRATLERGAKKLKAGWMARMPTLEGIRKKAERTAAAAAELIETERRVREEKTKRLKALRLAKERVEKSRPRTGRTGPRWG
jgi:hypothetical protein